MAEDRVLLPSLFRGTPDEDPAEFWRRLEVYMAYKNIGPSDQLRLVKAMFVENAQDWELHPRRKKIPAKNSWTFTIF